MAILVMDRRLPAEVPGGGTIALRRGPRGADGWRSHEGRLPAGAFAEACKVRVVPRDPGGDLPLELPLIA
jgi:hypothetical protein